MRSLMSSTALIALLVAPLVVAQSPMAPAGANELQAVIDIDAADLPSLRETAVAECADDVLNCIPNLELSFDFLSTSQAHLKTAEANLSDAVTLAEKLQSQVIVLDERYASLVVDFEELTAENSALANRLSNADEQQEISDRAHATEAELLAQIEARDIQLALLQEQLEDAITAQEVLSFELAAANDEKMLLSEEVSFTDQALNDLKFSLPAADALLAERDFEIASLNDVIIARDNQLAQSGARLDALNGDLASLLSDQEALKSRNKNLRDALGVSNQQITSLKTELNEGNKRREALRDQIATTARELASAREAEATAQAALDAANLRVNSLQNRLDTLDLTVANINGLLPVLQANLSQATDANRSQRGEIDQLSDALRQGNETGQLLREELDLIRDQFESKQSALAAAQMAREALEAERASLAEDLALTQEDLDSARAERAALLSAQKREVAALRQAIQSAQAEADAANRAAAEALEAAALAEASIGGSLFDSLFDDVTPSALRDVEDFAETAQNYLYNNVLAGWLRNRNFGNLEPIPGDKALYSSIGILDLQRDMNRWMRARGETMETLGLPAQFRRCAPYLCEDGIVGKRTKLAAELIYAIDPAFFPGAATGELPQATTVTNRDFAVTDK